jgi:hypothetical protein
VRLNAFATVLAVVAALTALPALAETPFGNVDEVKWDFGQAPGLVISGWTIDPDTGSSIDVHVYLNGNYLTSTTANWYRSDVGAAHPSYGSYHGFHVGIYRPEFEGDGEICIYAINFGPGSVNPLIGCRTVAGRHKTVQVCENSSGIDAGVALFNGDTVSITASGRIWSGVWFSSWNDANGWRGWAAGSNYPKPGANQYSLLVSFVGTPGSWWFEGTYSYWKLVSDWRPSTLFFRTNDDVPGNGDGCFSVRIDASY